MTEFDWSRVEPEAKIDANTFDSTLSQAISLKRIADALEKLLIVPKMIMPELTPEQEEELMDAMNKSSYFVNKP